MTGKMIAPDAANRSSELVLPSDMLKIREWSARLISSPAQLPISFNVEGKTITGIPDEWHPISQKRRIDANIIETLFEG